MWNYAELAQRASEAGGPEALMDSLVQEGVAKGHIEMVPVALLTLVVGGTIGAGLYKAADYYKEKKKKAEEEIKSTKETLLNNFFSKGIEQEPVPEAGA